MDDDTVGVRPPPPGVTPDFHSTPWLHQANRITVAVGLTVSTLFLLMRLYTKAYVIRKLWWDDVSIVLAWIFSIGTQATILYGYAHSSFAIHIWNMPVSRLVAYRTTILAVAVLYLPALAFAKLAVIMLYYRVLKSVRMWQYILWVLGAGISAYSLSLVLGLIFACHPIQAGWTVSPPAACKRRSGLYMGTAIANTASDVVLLAIPVTFLWGMHLPLLQKIGIMCLFGIGCLTVITSIVRLVTLIPLLASNDQPHNIGLACLFIAIEANFIILCGSAPYLRQFFRHHKDWSPRMRVSSKDTSRTERPGGIEMATGESYELEYSTRV
ncbi:hypothetical protein ASPZODRAFT_70649 [Penicilliopsis zonata CBS 506.65]|uniref:Rhodopsin domain-containing protein n=1 Tax=Penicilliopsis zonata CBS 506.65 TaxID=1073090 RepID=A0A1L9SD59_9EURO|nr:hypothetical protein ASPZODRAFT_70649 [Penicilliopsis zonata CBS 506.65]OJJ45034.1 hypothetical protein ASPZODRAFT_70649 [Penicilliopsis zonata CBS 506.65]